MKYRFAWASALTLAAIVSSQVETQALTNGVIIISTREPQDTASLGQDSLANRELYGCA
jgi:hypothetical protein